MWKGSSKLSICKSGKMAYLQTAVTLFQRLIWNRKKICREVHVCFSICVKMGENFSYSTFYWRTIWNSPDRGRGLRYHFFRYRYDTDTFQVWKVDTDTILILYKSEVLIPILILILWSSEIRYRYWYWYSFKKDWYQLWYQFFARNSHFFYQK